MYGTMIGEAPVGQLDTTVERGAAVGTLPPAFASTRRVPETPHAGLAVPVDGTAPPAAERVSETVMLTEIVCEGRTFEFNRPLPVRVVQEDGGWTCESPKEYNLLAYGHDRPDAESTFRHIFVYCWDDIACEADERLSRGARDQKRAFLALVKEQR